MYYYIYDAFVSDKKYERLVSSVENAITDLGIDGSRERATPIRPIEDLMKLALDKKNPTIILVGNDYTFTKAINAAFVLGAHPSNVIFGIIPVGEPNRMANILGIPRGSGSCTEISSRKIKKIDLGQVNKKFFLTCIDVGFDAEFKTRKDLEQEKIGRFKTFMRLRKYKPKEVKIFIEDKFHITSQIFNVSVINIVDNSYGLKSSSPLDGLLNVSIVPVDDKASLAANVGLICRKEYEQLPNASVFTASHLRITGPKSVKISTDGVLYDTLPLEIGILPKTLQVIVGKSRAF